jgi:hypothetical protein
MKIILASLCASFFIACGSEQGADVTIVVDPPANGANCVGVAGFQVTVSPTGRAPITEKLVDKATILDASSCRLPPGFLLADLEVDAAVTVTVTGYDGSGTKLRVIGSRTIPDLRQGEVHLSLEAAPLLPPQLLVFERAPFLGGAPVKDLQTIEISPQGGGTSLLNVNRDDAGIFMNPEPGAYGIDGLSIGQSVFVSLTAPGQMIREKRTIAPLGRHFTLGP